MPFSVGVSADGSICANLSLLHLREGGGLPTAAYWALPGVVSDTGGDLPSSQLTYFHIASLFNCGREYCGDRPGADIAHRYTHL